MRGMGMSGGGEGRGGGGVGEGRGGERRGREQRGKGMREVEIGGVGEGRAEVQWRRDEVRRHEKRRYSEMTGERAEEGGGGEGKRVENTMVHVHLCVRLKITLDKVHPRITALISPILTPLLTWQVVLLSLSAPFKVHCGWCLRRAGLEG